MGRDCITHLIQCTTMASTAVHTLQDSAPHCQKKLSYMRTFTTVMNNQELCSTTKKFKLYREVSFITSIQALFFLTPLITSFFRFNLWAIYSLCFESPLFLNVPMSAMHRLLATYTESYGTFKNKQQNKKCHWSWKNQVIAHKFLFTLVSCSCPCTFFFFFRFLQPTKWSFLVSL